MLITLLRAVALGILQGATEFIPVSSSAHLIIVPWLLSWDDPILTSLPFDVALHLGTLTAVLWYFAPDWVRLARAWLASLREHRVRSDPERRLAWLLLIGCIPGGVVGVLAESRIESLFHRPHEPIQPEAMIAMAAVMAIMGGLLYLADHLAKHRRDMGQLTLKDALLIGLAQAAAVFPGVSRSGATITAGLALGLERPTAARFSFLLSAPIIAGAGAVGLLELVQSWQAGAVTAQALIFFAVGYMAAAAGGYLCIRFLLRYLERHTVDIFVFYRWAAAILIVMVTVARS
jgi:undecaprenyl-diphosphatase